MGKRLIIQGADFSANGIKAINYKSIIYAKGDGSTTTGNECITINTVPMELSEVTIKVAFDFDGSVPLQQAGLLKGMISDTALRFAIHKTRNANDIPNIISCAYGGGSASNSLSIENGEHTFVADGESVYIDNNKIADRINNVEIAMWKVFYMPSSNFNPLVFKIKQITFTRNSDGVQLYNFLPAIDDDGVSGLYDAVNDSWHYAVVPDMLVAE